MSDRDQDELASYPPISQLPLLPRGAFRELMLPGVARLLQLSTGWSADGLTRPSPDDIYFAELFQAVHAKRDEIADAKQYAKNEADSVNSTRPPVGSRALFGQLLMMPSSMSRPNKRRAMSNVSNSADMAQDVADGGEVGLLVESIVLESSDSALGIELRGLSRFRVLQRFERLSQTRSRSAAEDALQLALVSELSDVRIASFDVRQRVAALARRTKKRHA